jgi:hypothetical protein
MDAVLTNSNSAMFNARLSFGKNCEYSMRPVVYILFVEENASC